MTVFFRDLSDFDTSEDLTGFVGATHKATEGTTVTHQQYGRRLNAFRAQGCRVLGSYHVVRTPGSGGNGSLSSQLNYWLSYLDSATPWWRTFPGFILQIDAEKWPYDQVSAATVLQFARLLVGAGVPGWKVTYASRGQYGNTLAGIATPLWNADYRGSSGGSYPGGGWTVASDGSTAGWAGYSGQAPTFLQYTSTPFDKNAFRGSLDELLTLIGGDMAAVDDIASNLDWQYPRLEALKTGQPIRTGPEAGATLWVNDHVKAIEDKLAAGLPATLSDADRAAIVAALPSAADVAAHLDYAALGAAVAAHIKVS